MTKISKKRKKLIGAVVLFALLGSIISPIFTHFQEVYASGDYTITFPAITGQPSKSTTLYPNGTDKNYLGVGEFKIVKTKNRLDNGSLVEIPKENQQVLRTVKRNFIHNSASEVINIDEPGVYEIRTSENSMLGFAKPTIPIMKVEFPKYENGRVANNQNYNLTIKRNEEPLEVLIKKYHPKNASDNGNTRNQTSFKLVYLDGVHYSPTGEVENNNLNESAFKVDTNTAVNDGESYSSPMGNTRNNYTKIPYGSQVFELPNRLGLNSDDYIDLGKLVPGRYKLIEYKSPNILNEIETTPLFFRVVPKIIDGVQHLEIEKENSLPTDFGISYIDRTGGKKVAVIEPYNQPKDNTGVKKVAYSADNGFSLANFSNNSLRTAPIEGSSVNYGENFDFPNSSSVNLKNNKLVYLIHYKLPLTPNNFKEFLFKDSKLKEMFGDNFEIGLVKPKEKAPRTTLVDNSNIKEHFELVGFLGDQPTEEVISLTNNLNGGNEYTFAKLNIQNLAKNNNSIGQYIKSQFNNVKKERDLIFEDYKRNGIYDRTRYSNKINTFKDLDTSLSFIVIGELREDYVNRLGYNNGVIRDTALNNEAEFKGITYTSSITENRGESSFRLVFPEQLKETPIISKDIIKINDEVKERGFLTESHGEAPLVEKGDEIWYRLSFKLPSNLEKTAAFKVVDYLDLKNLELKKVFFTLEDNLESLKKYNTISSTSKPVREGLYNQSEEDINSLVLHGLNGSSIPAGNRSGLDIKTNTIFSGAVKDEYNINSNNLSPMSIYDFGKIAVGFSYVNDRNFGEFNTPEGKRTEPYSEEEHLRLEVESLLRDTYKVGNPVGGATTGYIYIKAVVKGMKPGDMHYPYNVGNERSPKNNAESYLCSMKRGKTVVESLKLCNTSVESGVRSELVNTMLKIKKVNTDGEEVIGSKFKIKLMNDNGSSFVRYLKNSDLKEYGSDEDFIVDYNNPTENSNGYPIIGLKFNTHYELEEIQAPEGYRLSTKTFSIFIDKNDQTLFNQGVAEVEKIVINYTIEEVIINTGIKISLVFLIGLVAGAGMILVERHSRRKFKDDEAK